MITLTVNGSPQALTAPLTLAQLLDTMQLSGKRVAVERNSEIVPRSQYAQVDLQDGDTFLCGEELLRFELLALPRPAEMVNDDGTVFYGTPLRDGIGCRIVQLLLGGRMGMVYVPTKPQVLIGREACDLSFPRDRFISGRHTKVELQGRGFVLSDLGSKNGTYLRGRRLSAAATLSDGDEIRLGSVPLTFRVLPDTGSTATAPRTGRR